ncbi:MAG: hypothetical protein Q7U60_03750 [Candidatus Methanoperedens sp.]|nr:hypothetical protein [Candidatus Methanoperedens sp.]
MVHCKICKCNIGYMGWANHVRMHKRAFERVHGRPPENWQEVLEWYGVPAAVEKPVPVKERV